MRIQTSGAVRFGAALLLAYFLLLSGCGQGAQSGEPGPAQAVDVPSEVSAPPPPAPMTTPEPAEEVKKLWGFPIDNTHDAFEVPTGGRLGTLLVTVEMEAEGEDENTEYTSAFSVWDTSDLTKPIQTMVQEGVTTHTHKLFDANFDSYMDFCYTQYKGAKNENYSLYIWDEEQGRFSFVEGFLGSPGTNTKNKTFDNWSNGGGASASDRIFRWENDKLVCVREVMLGASEENGQELVVRDLVNGEMAEVFRETFPVSAYDASELWSDLDYHGEGMDLLSQQTVDDTHDAFLVPTGGRLGTLLVTVEMGEEIVLDGLHPLTFSVWNTGDFTNPIQEIKSDSGVFHHSHVVDANFDGYMDFGYMYAMGNQPCFSHYWLWDEEQGLFVAEPGFDEISCPVFDLETGTIDGYARGGFAGLAGTHTFHRWTGGALTCVRRVETYPEDGGACVTLTVEEPVDETLTEVFRKTADIADAEEFFDEVVRWLDLSYHGGT